MTTRNYPPVLDRKITRLIPAASPGNDPWGNSIPPDEDDAKKVARMGGAARLLGAGFCRGGQPGIGNRCRLEIYRSRLGTAMV